MKQNYDIDLSKLKADSALSQKENESAKERNRSLEMESQSYNETISNLTDTCIALQIHHQSAIRKITALSGAIAG
jgi:FtsZ-binding cell division protein ZapB